MFTYLRMISFRREALDDMKKFCVADTLFSELYIILEQDGFLQIQR